MGEGARGRDKLDFRVNIHILLYTKWGFPGDASVVRIHLSN